MLRLLSSALGQEMLIVSLLLPLHTAKGFISS